MFKYSTIYINIVSFVISIIIFFILVIFYSNSNQITQKSVLKAGFKVENEIENIQINSKEIEKNNKEEDKQKSWFLEIPCINLKANIQEGTTKEVMDEAIGHFLETSKNIGNIGLAAHNRGYKNNYFENLKKIKEGDEIYYYYDGIVRKYIVIKHCIIKDVDWSYLENTEENTITLITCVENEPEYRRCIQGIEKNEREEF